METTPGVVVPGHLQEELTQTLIRSLAFVCVIDPKNRPTLTPQNPFCRPFICLSELKRKLCLQILTANSLVLGMQPGFGDLSFYGPCGAGGNGVGAEAKRELEHARDKISALEKVGDPLTQAYFNIFEESQQSKKLKEGRE